LKSKGADQDLPQDFFQVYTSLRRKIKLSVLTGGNFSECCREPEEWGFPGID
jgi:hypothetical protein